MDIKARRDALVQQHAQLVQTIQVATEQRLRVEGAILLCDELLKETDGNKDEVGGA